jgi:SAM-dependent methyltransferase
MTPYTAHPQQVDRAPERAVSSLAEQVETTDARAGIRTEQVDLRLAEVHTRVLAQLRLQQQQLSELSTALRRTGGELASLQPRLQGPERLLAETRALPFMSSDVFRVFDAGPAGSVFGYEAAHDTEDTDAYREFEELFRGSEAFIADRQRRYLDIVAGCEPAVDVGCGRGEFLDVLASAGIAATGVDSDAGMVARCRAKGHEATVLGDGVAHLESLEDASLGLVFSAQVIEHMPPQTLQRFLAVAARKLRPDGLLVTETVNPHSAAALKAFWVDITHQHPLFPETMLALTRIAGFSSAYVFHPNGSGDVESDRFDTGEYAVVARR